MYEIQVRRPCAPCRGTGNAQSCSTCNGTGKQTVWVAGVLAASILGHSQNAAHTQELMDSAVDGTLTVPLYQDLLKRAAALGRSAEVAATEVEHVDRPLSAEDVRVAVHTWPLQTQLDAFQLLQRMHTPLRVLEYQAADEQYPAFLMRELQREKLETLTLRQLCQLGTARLTQLHHLSESALRQLHHLAAGVSLSFNA